MQKFKLEKDVILYKAQFDNFMMQMFNSHYMDRVSMDLDALLFRAKYIYQHQKDLDQIHELRKEFTNKSLEMQDVFAKFLFAFLCKVVTIPEPFHLDDLYDVMVQDVKIDPVYVKFKMIVISESRAYLEYIDQCINSEKPYNMFPDQYFRFFTDSYNDGITKAYPELFEKKHIDGVETADGDIFCHNFTFQVTEDCSLNCFPKGTKIIMEDDCTKKNIEDIKVGDRVLGIPEDMNEELGGYHPYHNKDNYVSSEVTHIFHRQAETISVIYHFGGEHDELFRVTKEHPFLTVGGEFKTIEQIIEDDDAFIWRYRDGGFTQMNAYELQLEPYGVEEVYNIETTTHTYIANSAVVHNCSYCYQCNKSPMRMDVSTAKKFIDKLLRDEYGYINRHNSPAIIIEFIGGEPLLEIKLIRQIYEYFLDQCYELNHPWFTLHRISLCSNGMQYFDPAVQEFFKLYHDRISFNISIDGNKELHDACRKQANGEGSYDICMTALNHYTTNYTPERNSKMTLAPSNITYLFDSVIGFINHGMTIINLNCVFEEGWTQTTAREEYYQLKKLADYLIDNHLENLYIAIFNEKQEDMQDKYQDGNFCGGLGSMLAMRPNGQFYPCIRYMPSSVGDNVPDLNLGNVHTGMIGREESSPVLDMMDKITRRSQSNDICYECPISNDCAWCSALGHAVYGTPNKRPMFACIQMIAEALANVYYWNRLLLAHPEYNLDVRINNVPDEWSLLVISRDELDELKLLECAAVIKKLEGA